MSIEKYLQCSAPSRWGGRGAKVKHISLSRLQKLLRCPKPSWSWHLGEQHTMATSFESFSCVCLRCPSSQGMAIALLYFRWKALQKHFKHDSNTKIPGVGKLVPGHEKPFQPLKTQFSCPSRFSWHVQHFPTAPFVRQWRVSDAAGRHSLLYALQVLQFLIGKVPLFAKLERAHT